MTYIYITNIYIIYFIYYNIIRFLLKKKSNYNLLPDLGIRGRGLGILKYI